MLAFAWPFASKGRLRSETSIQDSDSLVPEAACSSPGPQENSPKMVVTVLQSLEQNSSTLQTVWEESCVSFILSFAVSTWFLQLFLSFPRVPLVHITIIYPPAGPLGPWPTPLWAAIHLAVDSGWNSWSLAEQGKPELWMCSHPRLGTLCYRIM